MLRRPLALLLLATTAVVSAFAQSQTGTQMGSATYLSYNPFTRASNLSQLLLYELPDPSIWGAGPYPVFMWVPGTLELYNDQLSLLMIDQMAQRGFLSVSVQYNNLLLLAQSCPDYTARALSIFDATTATSGVSTVCAMSSANCSQGLVTSGVSQGGNIAILSANYAPQVQAVFAMSAGDYLGVGSGVDFSACLAKANTTIPSNRLTIVNGANDTLFGSLLSTTGASGVSCDPGTAECWSPDASGAGWILVPGSLKTSGSADHCYMAADGCTSKLFDPNWLPPATYNWSLAPNLDWLASLGTARVLSSTGQ